MTPSIGLNLRVTGYCNQGGRKYMEDVFRYVLTTKKYINKGILELVSVQGVESLWGDCRFIPADWGS